MIIQLRTADMLPRLRGVVTIGAYMPDFGGRTVEYRIQVQGDTQEELRRFALRKFHQIQPHAEDAVIRRVELTKD